MLKHIADEDFQTYTYQNHTSQYLGFACQLCSEFTSNDKTCNTDNKCDGCNNQRPGPSASHIQQW